MHYAKFTIYLPQKSYGSNLFFVSSNVAKYKAFNRAILLGNTLLWRFSFLYVEFNDSIAFVVYITFLTVSENLNIVNGK